MVLRLHKDKQQKDVVNIIYELRPYCKLYMSFTLQLLLLFSHIHFWHIHKSCIFLFPQP